MKTHLADQTSVSGAYCDIKPSIYTPLNLTHERSEITCMRCLDRLTGYVRVIRSRAAIQRPQNELHALIRSLRAQGHTIKDIAQHVGRARNTVHRILGGKRS